MVNKQYKASNLYGMTNFQNKTYLHLDDFLKTEYFCHKTHYDRKVPSTKWTKHNLVKHKGEASSNSAVKGKLTCISE